MELFEINTLDKAFQRALVVKRKVAPKGCTPQSQYFCPNLPPQNTTNHTSSHNINGVQPRTTNATTNAQWFSFHNIQSHSFAKCRVLKALRTNKTLFTEATTSQYIEDIEVVPLNNPPQVDPALILMTSKHTKTPSYFFSHNCQIKQSLALMVMDNGSQKYLVSQDLVHKLNLHTSPHPNPYQLG